MSIELLTLLLFGSLFLVMALGVPIFVSLGAIAVIYGYLLWGPQAFFIAASQLYGIATSSTFLAIPMFLLMAYVLQSSGIADELFETIYHWMGGLRGGLAMGTVVICTLFAAMSGVSSAATVSMGLIALPAMFKRGYNKTIALGCVSAGGVLGIVIPPSVEMIIYGQFCRESVGGMFAGGMIAGILIASMHITYIGIRSALQPNLCPVIPAEERVGLREKISLLKSVFLPLALIIAVLGSIYTGAATPIEAAGVGALGAFLCAAVSRRLRLKVVKQALLGTARLYGMIIFIAGAVTAFNGVYMALGGHDLAMELVSRLPVNRWLVLVAMQLSLFLLGMVMEDYAIIMLIGPIYYPIVAALGFDTLWWGVVFILNMQVAYLTPPFGWNLFLLKAIVPEGITMGDIYRSIVPFTVIQALGLAICMIFPQLVLWLPNMIFR